MQNKTLHKLYDVLMCGLRYPCQEVALTKSGHHYICEDMADLNFGKLMTQTGEGTLRKDRRAKNLSQLADRADCKAALEGTIDT